MMEALKDRVWFEGVFIGLGGIGTGGGTDSLKKIPHQCWELVGTSV